MANTDNEKLETMKVGFEKETGSPVAHVVTPTPSVDSFRRDEASRIIDEYTAGGGSSDWTEEEENRLRRKIDWRLTPVLCFSLFMQYYDKAILSQAAIFGMRRDLDLAVGNRFSIASAIFYLGYMVGTYPISLLAQKYPTRHVISGLVTIWGICLTLTVTCSNYRGLYAQRFFLGLLEGPIAPVFTMICGGWYRKNEQALRIGYWMAANPIGVMLSPLVNYGLGSANSGVAPWKLMFLVPGAITIVWGIAIWFLLPADPISARGLTDRERYIAVARLRSNNAGVRNTHVKPAQIVELLTDLKFWVCFLIAVLALIVNGPTSSFIPTIINGFGFAPLTTLLLQMPGGAYGAVLVVGTAWVSARKPGWRCWLIVFCSLITVLASCLLWKLPLSNRAGLLAAASILPSGIGAYSLLVGIQIANTAGFTKRAASSAGIFVGYCLGNFIGPLLFRQQDAPRYVMGFTVITVASALASVLIVVYRYMCLWENRRRDQAGIGEGFENAYDDDLTDKKNPQFRYIV